MFNGGWFRVDIVKSVRNRDPVILREGVDGVYAIGYREALEKAFERNPVKPGELIGVQPLTGWRNRRAVLANERRSNQIRELYEIMEKVR